MLTPRGVLNTRPRSPRAVATRNTHGRNPTPCTVPSISISSPDTSSVARPTSSACPRTSPTKKRTAASRCRLAASDSPSPSSKRSPRIARTPARGGAARPIAAIVASTAAGDMAWLVALWSRAAVTGSNENGARADTLASTKTTCSRSARSRACSTWSWKSVSSSSCPASISARKSSPTRRANSGPSASSPRDGLPTASTSSGGATPDVQPRSGTPVKDARRRAPGARRTAPPRRRSPPRAASCRARVWHTTGTDRTREWRPRCG